MKPSVVLVAVTAAVLASWTATGLFAQQGRPAFEVASIRPQTAPATIAEAIGWPRARPGGRFSGTHARLEWLITYAYNLRPFQVIGGPEWLRTDYFAVDARAASDVSEDDLRLMVQSLLEERFRLVAHTEQRDMRYLALRLAREDGQWGPALHRLDDGACIGKTVAEVFEERFPGHTSSARNRIAGACIEFGDIAELVGLQMDALVIDRTGLRGKWVFSAPFGGNPRLASTRLGAPVRVEGGSAADPGVPPLTVTLEEQLGLKLESESGPVDVLVIDSVQQPTAN